MIESVCEYLEREGASNLSDVCGRGNQKFHIVLWRGHKFLTIIYEKSSRPSLAVINDLSLNAVRYKIILHVNKC